MSTKDPTAWGTYSACRQISWRRVGATAAVLGLAAWFLWRARAIVPPFAISFFLAALLDPIAARIQRSGASRARAVGSIFLVAFMTVVLAVVLIVPTIVGQISGVAGNLSSYAQTVTTRTESLTAQADTYYGTRRSTFESLGVRQPPSQYLRENTGAISNGAKTVLDAIQAAIAGALGQVLWLVIIPLSLFYFLLEFPTIRLRLASLLPEDQRAGAEQMAQDVVEVFGAYVRGLAKVCLLYGAAATTLFFVLRLDYSLFLGMGAGILYAVPYVGPALAVASVLVISITAGKGFALALMAAGLFFAMHLMFDYGITPRVVGGSVGLHPLVNIFALMSGAALFGVWGMLLAVPVAASIQKLLFHFYPWLAAPPIIAPVLTAAGDDGGQAPSPASETTSEPV